MKQDMRNLIASVVLTGAMAAQAAPGTGLSERVAAQIAAPGTAAVAWYAVPALSPVKRVPDVFPEDGKPGGTLQVVAARGEFEPASFLVFSFKDIGKAELKASALTGPAGTLPVTAVDVKIVKCWYQSGTAWHSYFSDNAGRELVPELLVNDEALVRVDAKTRDNYLRVDKPSGPDYAWISNPSSVNVPFNTETEPVADAKTLQPFRLDAGLFKQFWVTVKIPADAVPGLYAGAVTLSAAGLPPVSIPLAVRVLPFELPAPATYYDPGREFYTMLYNDPGYAEILKENGGDWVHADRKMSAIYENMRDHNIRHPRVDDYQEKSRDAFIRQLELLRETGLATDPIFGAIPGIPPYDYLTATTVVANLPSGLISRVDASFDIVTNLFGHSNVYCFGWDEPSRRLVVAERKPWKYIHDKGLKIYSTATDAHLKYGGYNEDFVNCPGGITRERAAKWHAMGQRITNYASPHTGPENPDFMRRVHGLQLYKANYDGIGNYILSCNRWNDFLGDSYNFRGFNMTYPTRDGVLDTLEWEGTREAVDDVRYATLLKTMAAKAIATGKTEAGYAGRRALQWLELLDETSADLNTARLEMVDRILALRAFADFPPSAPRPVTAKASARPAAATAPAALTPDEIVATNRAIMARTRVLPRTYRLAVFTLIETLGAQGKSAEAKAAAEAAGADVKLDANDRFLAKLIAAGFGAAVTSEDLARASAEAAAAVTNAPIAAEAKLAAYQDAGKYFMKRRQVPAVRAFLALADGLYRPEPKKNYHCRFEDKIPTTADAWMAGAFVKDAKNGESRFEPYNKKAADLLINDVNAVRDVASGTGEAEAGTVFFMACNTEGWSIFVDCRDPEAEKVEAGLLSGGQLEMFFAPGASECYYQWFVGFPKSELKAVSWNSPNRHYRDMEAYGKSDVAAGPGGFGAGSFIPWELVYDKLPANGEAWPFNVIRWGRSGGLTWHGKVHNIHDFGTITFEGLTPERLSAIRRKLVMKGFGNYQKARTDLVALWKDDVLGDPAFYEKALKPAVEKLDALGVRVDPGMKAETSDALFEEAVPDWMEFSYKAAELRRDYLADKLVTQGGGQ